MGSRGYTHPGKRTTSIYDPLLGPAPTLWADCPLSEYRHDPTIGTFLDESFQSYNATATTGDYLLTQTTSGTAAISTTFPGCLAINAGAATVTQGAEVQRLKSMFLPASGKDIWFEARVQMATAITGQFIIGMASSDTTLITTSAVTNQNHIMWSSVTNDGVLLFDCDKAGTGTTAAATSLSTSAWIRLGFKYDGTADTVQQYINGVATGSAIATTYISKSAMYPSFVCKAGGTGQPVMHFHYRVFQLR